MYYKYTAIHKFDHLLSYMDFFSSFKIFYRDQDNRVEVTKDEVT